MRIKANAPRKNEARTTLPRVATQLHTHAELTDAAFQLLAVTPYRPIEARLGKNSGKRVSAR